MGLAVHSAKSRTEDQLFWIISKTHEIKVEHSIQHFLRATRVGKCQCSKLRRIGNSETSLSQVKRRRHKLFEKLFWYVISEKKLCLTWLTWALRCTQVRFDRNNCFFFPFFFSAEVYLNVPQCEKMNSKRLQPSTVFHGKPYLASMSNLKFLCLLPNFSKSTI